ncbi:DnaJ domain protein [Aspergillus alliaceus]|uniref:DnaJ domain protein n=1 Tax=Petromyces alliaceus TaxID=209559 RepID=UPI0012A3DDFB|nr:uncharacterized protein BDW43DRAFT_82622 [Aspergillus alliaceus]KAB8233625.1 hypothetical protein BDW43DRAFT_82622 [Aspergillus alliaceus]
MAPTSRRTVMNCYEILAISPNADLKDINSAYKKLALKYHPDKTTADDALKFRKIQAAVEILRDEARREQHDAELQSSRAYAYMYENIPFTKKDTSSGWSATSPDLFALRSMRGRYMYSYANSVHMDPNSPESQEEIRRCEREREYGEQLRRECEQWGAYGGDPGLSGMTWTYGPAVEEQMREATRREGMRVNVMRDEEQVMEGEVLEEDVEPESFFERNTADTNGQFGFGEQVGEEEYEQHEKGGEYGGEQYYTKGEELGGEWYEEGEYEGEEEYEHYEACEGDEDYTGYEEQEEHGEGEEYYEEGGYEGEEGYEDDDEYDAAGGYDGAEAEKEDAKSDPADSDSITSTQQTQAEYESARQAPASDTEGLLDMESTGQSVNIAEHISTILEAWSDTNEYETFHSLGDEDQDFSHSDNATSHGTPSVESPPRSPSFIDPFIPHFKEKLNHPSGRYTEDDLHAELRGLVMESFCGWIENIRLKVPGAEHAETVESPEQCRHLGFWEKEFGSSECEVCHRWMPIYTLSCPGCGIKACVRCKFEYEK